MTTPPRINDRVHYRSFGTPGGEYEPVCRAATITEVGAWVQMGAPKETVEGEHRVRMLPQVWEPEACFLTVLNPGGLFQNTPILRHEPAPHVVGSLPVQVLREHRGGTWHSPEGCDA